MAQCVVGVFFDRNGFKDGFKGISCFYEHLEKCRAIFVVLDYVSVFNGKSCGDAVLLVAC